MMTLACLFIQFISQLSGSEFAWWFLSLNSKIEFVTNILISWRSASRTGLVWMSSYTRISHYIQGVYWPCSSSSTNVKKKEPVTPPIACTSDLQDFRANFWNSHISGMNGPIDMEWKVYESMVCWSRYMTLTLDLAHEHDLGFSSSNSEFHLGNWWSPMDWLTCNERNIHW